MGLHWIAQIALFSTLCCLQSTLYAKDTVVVGGYLFPPFVERTEQGITGASVDLITAFNEAQEEFEFVFRETAPKRRYIDFEEKRIDILFFESIHWGWEGYPVTASKVFMRGGEVYITFNQPGRDQSYFDDIDSKRLIGILGYHYRFANYNAEEAYLSKNFKISLSEDHLRNINLILLNRPEIAEVAIVTESFLKRFFNENPHQRPRILIANTKAQEYEHTILMRKGSPTVLPEKVNQLLGTLEANGALSRIRQKYGISK